MVHHFRHLFVALYDALPIVSTTYINDNNHPYSLNIYDILLLLFDILLTFDNMIVSLDKMNHSNKVALVYI